MLPKLLTSIFGSRNERLLKQYRRVVTQINALEPGLEALSDEQLRAKTDEFRERHAKGETLDALLPEAFAVVREGSKRTLKMRHFDVQLLGGMTLHNGKIAEMRTGEGKTLMATLPVYLNAISGKGVHVVTVNDYLARRDAEWMGRLYNFLGLSVQASEFMKPAFVVIVAWLFAENARRTDIPGNIFALILLGIVVSLLVADTFPALSLTHAYSFFGPSAPDSGNDFGARTFQPAASGSGRVPFVFTRYPAIPPASAPLSFSFVRFPPVKDGIWNADVGALVSSRTLAIAAGLTYPSVSRVKAYSVLTPSPGTWIVYATGGVDFHSDDIAGGGTGLSPMK